ncbi:hypothetical protein BOH66_14735 [Microbacterium aurum]|uniref:homocysteine desulfhydrase n=1 Tax=Microbacterium aurum TaxID=36805 RepID=A0A1P8UB66_9MICO|nr:PLP-dependent transferase [Microbacterium aurum]APZ35361.1 hypothetical protein BOH66_14735 [Microbacterium aurum]MBM7826013.1 cystathionine beta-lyase/cystathionine gamma-synthase [Microbacterium aurum]
MNGFSTNAIHGGSLRDQYGSHVLPVYRTAAFDWESTDAAARTMASFLDGSNAGESYVYSRVSNPTVTDFEHRVASLYGAGGAVAFASGMGAIAGLLFSVLKAGDHVVYGESLYSATTHLIGSRLPPFGIETTAVDTMSLDAVQRAIRPNTRLIYCETPANPTMGLTDLSGIARLAAEANALSVVDNTFATAFNTQPLELGIDVVVESATKYIEQQTAALAVLHGA